MHLINETICTFENFGQPLKAFLSQIKMLAIYFIPLLIFSHFTNAAKIGVFVSTMSKSQVNV